MILLVSKSPRSKDMARWVGDPNIGHLVTPRSRWLPDPAYVWAADNDAYSGFDPVAYRRMLERIEGIEGCMFVTLPDVVGDASATFDMADVWIHELLSRFPLGLVAQDGMTVTDVDWWSAAIDCLFVGGTTEWKMGRDAARLVARAKELGLLVHMGRVNSAQRLRYAMALGCDSVDGSSMAQFTLTHLERFRHQAASPRQRLAKELM